MHIPADITNLTGIRDSDVQDAPLEKEAMEMVPQSPVLGWVGGRFRQQWENTLEKHIIAVDQR